MEVWIHHQMVIQGLYNKKNSQSSQLVQGAGWSTDLTYLLATQQWSILFLFTQGTLCHSSHVFMMKIPGILNIAKY